MFRILPLPTSITVLDLNGFNNHLAMWKLIYVPLIPSLRREDLGMLTYEYSVLHLLSICWKRTKHVAI